MLMGTSIAIDDGLLRLGTWARSRCVEDGKRLIVCEFRWTK